MTSIFIVDDNPVNLKVLNALLTNANYRVMQAGSAEEALEALTQGVCPDLFILDVNLPGISGIELCRKLKNDPGTAGIPIILISATMRDKGSIREGLEAGAEGYLAQPIEDMALRAWIRTTLRLSELQRDLQAKADATSVSDDAVNLIHTLSRMSHAVNNPLQALYAAADLMSLDMPEGAPASDLVRDILSNAERVAEIVAASAIRAKAYLAASGRENTH